MNCDISLVSGSENGRGPAYVSSHGFKLAPVLVNIHYHPSYSRSKNITNSIHSGILVAEVDRMPRIRKS